jgi:cytidylate kinase
MHREIAPLKQADDAVLVDTTELNLEESADAIVKVIESKIN